MGFYGLYTTYITIRAVGTFVSRYRIDSLELEKAEIQWIKQEYLQHRIGGLEKIRLYIFIVGILQHRIGGL